MSTSLQTKGKRSCRITLGFNSGVPAFVAGGAAAGGATTFLVTRGPGDFSIDFPQESEVDPLDRGQFMLDQAPILTDDQGASGSFTAYYTHQTDPAALGLMDILNETGLAAALPNVTPFAERLRCDIKVEFIHPANPADAHGYVIEQARLTYGNAIADPSTISTNFASRSVRPTIVF